MAIPGVEKYWGTDTFATEAFFYLYISHYAIHIPIDKSIKTIL